MRSALSVLLCVFCFSCSHNGEKISGKAEVVSGSEDSFEPPLSNAAPDLSLSYQVLSKRKIQKLKNVSMKDKIDAWFLDRAKFKIDAYTDFILDLTAENLEFTFGAAGSDPEAVLRSGKANCVGYASLFCAFFNYGMKSQHLDAHYKCVHCVGRIFMAGKNIHTYFNDPFFKDHDFNLINCIENGKTIAVDPSLFDYMGIRRVKVRK